MSYANEQVADTASQRNPEVDGGGTGEEWAITKVRQAEIWNNLRVTMINDRLIFDGVRSSVKLHHEIESEEFAGRFTKNWFDANYKDIYGFHSKSIDRGTVRELRRAHGARQAEATEGPGYNGPHA